MTIVRPLLRDLRYSRYAVGISLLKGLYWCLRNWRQSRCQGERDERSVRVSHAVPTDRGTDTMASVLVRDASTAVQLTRPPSIDTVRALCHDLRQPLAAIRLLAGSEGGDVGHRMDGILDQAQWLSDMVEGVIGGAADGQPVRVDVADLASRCVARAQATALCRIGFIGADPAWAVSAPVALSRAVS